MPEKTSKVRRSAAEIATEDAEQASRAVEKARRRVADAQAARDKAEADVERLTRTLDYRLKHPDLPEGIRAELASAAGLVDEQLPTDQPDVTDSSE
jgi:enoyl-CoA hydratase/carnithine racemase